MKRTLSLSGVLLAFLLLVAACASSAEDSAIAPTTTTTTTSSTATATAEATSTPTATIAPPETASSPSLAELQTIGSHNSYHLAPEGAVAAGLELFAPAFAASIDYSHLPLRTQLEEFGIRQIELDVFADPEGGRYANRNLLAIAGEPVESGIPELDVPGFKVLHIQDIDFETTCYTLIVCLQEVEVWSSANPDHVPLMVLLETKTESLDEAAAELGVDISAIDVELTEPLKMTPELFADLEAEVLSVFARERIITPDEVRGDHPTLDEAVGDGGWPTLEESMGRVIFALDDRGAGADTYREGAPALEGRLFFTSADVGDPDGAFFQAHDPIADAAAIDVALAAGYLVRTRADANTLEARTGDVSRRDAALTSGAHWVSTDYYVEDVELSTGYVVSLPGGSPVRCNPVTASSVCEDP